VNRAKLISSLVLLLVAGLVTAGYASANSSSGFREIEGDIFDDWEICRTRSFGEDGFYQISETSFRPVIVFQSLGENASLAYSLGEQFTQKYSDPIQRAEQIFNFVRDRVRYTPDKDQFGHDEFAQNADELAITISENKVGFGDCEDSAVLLAVMYKGAGYRSAIVLGSGHTAAVVFLPDYKKPAAVFDIEDEPGWIWAEATGKNNPLGWVPKELKNVQLSAYEITTEAIDLPQPNIAPSIDIIETGGSSLALPFPFIGIIGLLWFISLLRRRR
jgi:hypothetical protein